MVPGGYDSVQEAAVTQADGITGDAGADGSEPDVVQPLSRRDRLRAATTAEILQTARRLLVESGPEAVSLRAIAREMGMTAPGLYRYFGSHEELIRHVIAGIFTEHGADIHQAISTATDSSEAAHGARQTAPAEMSAHVRARVPCFPRL